jgi:hypothetical protein
VPLCHEEIPFPTVFGWMRGNCLTTVQKPPETAATAAMTPRGSRIGTGYTVPGVVLER